MNPPSTRRDQARKFVRPFDNRDAVAKEIFVEPEPLRGLLFLKTKQIEMVNRNPPACVFMNERKRWAGYWNCRSDTCDEALDELGLTCAERPHESDHASGGQITGKLATGRFRLGRAIRNVSSHWEILRIFDF